MDFLVVPNQLKGIKTITRLSRTLGVPVTELEMLIADPRRHYHPYKKTKSNGKKRTIDNPAFDLKRVQRVINSRLLKPVHASFPPYVVGAIKGRNPLQNALKHMRAEAALKFDLKDCYGSISDGKVHEMWMKYYDCSPTIATVLMKLTSLDKGLPQGAPTSSTIANIVLFTVLVDINDFCTQLGMTFTMFVDDGTVSGEKACVRNNVGSILDIVRRHGYRLARHKTQVILRGRDQMSVTGLSIYAIPKPNQSYIDKTRRQVIEDLRNDKRLSQSTIGTINYIRTYDPKTAAKIGRLVDRISKTSN